MLLLHLLLASSLGLSLPAQDPSISKADLRAQMAELDAAALEEEAATWKTLIESTLAAARGAGDATALETAKQTVKRELAPRMDVVVDALGSAGGETKVLQAWLIQVTGDPTYGSAAASLDLLTRWTGEAKEWVRENGWRLLVRALLLVALLFASKLAGNIAGGIVGRALETSRFKTSELLEDFLVNSTRKVVFFLGLLFALSSVGISIGPFLAAFGAAGVIIGFALSETLNNFAAGVMILLYRPYDVGDTVEASGIRGKVHAMTLVSTTLLTPDNQTIIVPNGSIWGGTITNITANPERRVEIIAGIGYDDDVQQAEALLQRLCDEHPLVLKDPEPLVRLNELADSSVNFVVRVWVATGDFGTVRWDLLRSIKLEFDKAGISIPYPQQDIHIHQQPEAS